MTSISLTRSERPGTTRLWIAQGVLAALFLFAGAMKLLTPAAELAAQAHMPGGFIKFIGACETLGALGLILPGVLHIQERLTPIAAAGLTIIMTGAVVTTLAQGQPPAAALLPAVVGVISTYVARGRSR